MATMPEVNEIVINRLELLLKPRWNPDSEPKKYLEMTNLYVRALTAYPPDALRQGMDAWALGWNRTTWPLPAQLVPYINAAANELRPERQTLPPPDETNRRDRTPEEIAEYRAETKRIVARINERLGWLDKYPVSGGTFSRKIEPQHVPMPKHFIERLVPSEET